jgi:pyruvate kinase
MRSDKEHDSTIVIARQPSPRRRRTKIVATLGPASDSPETLEELIRAGVDVVRINFSHGAAEHQESRIKLIRELAAKVGRYVGIMGDLQGPKIRIRSFVNGFEKLSKGQAFTLDTEMGPAEGTNSVVGVAYPDLPKDLEAGDVLLLDDGQIVMSVVVIEGAKIRCTVVRGGVLKDLKGLNKQGGGLSAGALTDKDREDIVAAARFGLDFIAVSFVRGADDVIEARRLFREAGGQGHVVAKIERTEAVENIKSIIEASDAIMVARGDLAVEVGYAAMTGLQKGLIRTAIEMNTVSITATQMLESMITSESPTRAEVSDVANAVLDGTDAVMLSAETAVGLNPVLAVKTMADVCIGAEKHETSRGVSHARGDDEFKHVDQAIAMAVMYTANHLKVRAIIAMTESGSTALWMSRRHSEIPIYAYTRQATTRRRVTLYRGVFPVEFDIISTPHERLHEVAYQKLLNEGELDRGDLVLFTQGQLDGIAGGTNCMQILKVP